MRSLLSCLLATILALGALLLFFMGVVAVVHFFERASDVLWPFLGRLPIVCCAIAIGCRAYDFVCEMLPTKRPIAEAIPEEVFWAKREAANWAFLHERELRDEKLQGKRTVSSWKKDWVG